MHFSASDQKPEITGDGRVCLLLIVRIVQDIFFR
jgi:hypothetical protein